MEKGEGKRGRWEEGEGGEGEGGEGEGGEGKRERGRGRDGKRAECVVRKTDEAVIEALLFVTYHSPRPV